MTARPSPFPRSSSNTPGLNAADRLVVTLVRRLAMGQSLSAITTAAARVPAGMELGVVEGVAALTGALDDDRGPEIQLRPVPCRHVSADEKTILRLLALCQAGEGDSARVLAATLVRSERLERLMGTAERFAAALTGAGLALTPSAPPPASFFPAIAAE